MLLDLGGIAKGFAVDQAIHALRRGGCTEAIVNAGGDLRRFGRAPHPIYLRRSTGPVQVAELRCGAVATSRPYKSVPDQLLLAPTPTADGYAATFPIGLQLP